MAGMAELTVLSSYKCTNEAKSLAPKSDNSHENAGKSTANDTKSSGKWRGKS